MARKLFKLSELKEEKLDKTRMCLSMECLRIVRKGEKALVLRWAGDYGKKTSVFCNEQCWQDYDDEHFQTVAERNQGTYQPDILDYV